eukprot:gene9876-10923_t
MSGSQISWVGNSFPFTNGEDGQVGNPDDQQATSSYPANDGSLQQENHAARKIYNQEHDTKLSTIKQQPNNIHHQHNGRKHSEHDEEDDNPKFKKQLDEALERGISFMMVVFGGDEVEAGQVKVKDMVKKEEVVLPREELVAELVRRGCKVISSGYDSVIPAMKQADSLPTPPANVEEETA